MDKHRSQTLFQMNCARLSGVLLDIQHDNHLVVEKGLSREARPVLEQIGDTGDDLRAQGYDTLAIALALVYRARAMMWESEPRHKCELFAEALKSEADNFRECTELYFTDSPLAAVETQAPPDETSEM